MHSPNNLKLSIIFNPIIWFATKTHLIIEEKTKTNMKVYLIIPPHNEVVGEVYWFHSIHLSVRPSVPPASLVHAVVPTVLIWSISITSYQATSEAVSRTKSLAKFLSLNLWQSFKICNFDFVFLTWDLMWITSQGNHGVAGVSQNAGVLVVLVFSIISIVRVEGLRQ